MRYMKRLPCNGWFKTAKNNIVCTESKNIIVFGRLAYF